MAGGYWVQDLPLSTDNPAPTQAFDPANPFEFSFWFYAEASGPEVSLVSNWDRGVGNSTTLLSMSLTGATSGGFQTLTVVSGFDVPGPNPVVSANTWHHFDAVTGGLNAPVHLLMDGESFGPATFASTPPPGRVTVLMGDTRGGSPSPAAYDDVYLGPPASLSSPLSQCPVVGMAHSCAILIVINADRTVSVLGDASVPPYDGDDDTLVGVQNNSSSPVSALTVSGPPGSGIFAFDGDGVCTFRPIPCGNTGYEGATSTNSTETFVLDPSSSDRGEIDFSGNGLTAGQSGYFGLEGALNAAAIAAQKGGLLVTITNVTVANGSVSVAWQLTGTPSSPITGYVVSALTPLDGGNDRVPPPVPSTASVVVPASATSTTVHGLTEDCHQQYSITVVPEMGPSNFGPGATWGSVVQPSGIVSRSEPQTVVILLDGVDESKPEFTVDPYRPNPAGQTANPTYCPEQNAFLVAPNGPKEFFTKWNLADPGENSDSTPRVPATGQLSHAFMLDAIAAQGAVILPYSYKGAYLTKSPGADPVFHFPKYTECEASPYGAPCGGGGDRQDIYTDANMLETEVSSIKAVWKDANIIVIGHSQGGLVALEWWLIYGAYSNGRSHVTHLFSLDAPINGVCVGGNVGPFNLPCVGPVTYPPYQARDSLGKEYLQAEAAQPDAFRFLGTWGEMVFGYGSGNDTLQRQLLVTGPNCGNGTDNSSCPAPPDHISGCPITGNDSWITGSDNYHFVVKWCPDDVEYVNKVLGLKY